MPNKRIIYLGPIENSKRAKKLINKLGEDFISEDILVNSICDTKNGVEIRPLDGCAEIDIGLETPREAEIYREDEGDILVEFSYKKGFYRIFNKSKKLDEIRHILN